LHLLEQRPPTSAIYSVKGDDMVQQVRYLEGRVWINATQSFEGVPREVWQFRIGGYQVCQKWLKDRKGSRLAHEDQACYGQIVGAIAQTIRLMHDIDTVIDQHGGWPIAQA